MLGDQSSRRVEREHDVERECNQSLAMLSRVPSLEEIKTRDAESENVSFRASVELPSISVVA
jgi:hypothetical protein